MIRFMLVMVPLVFLINGLTKHDWKDAFFFALAVAVGLTPEMLPMIVAVCLSKGAIAMSRKKVIVKRLNSIQNLGAMDVLCTDKTGTLTMDRVILEKHCDVVRQEDEERAGAGLSQQPFPDRSQERARPGHPCSIDRECTRSFRRPSYTKVDEIPFDFSRKMMSVVVKTPEGKHRLICKGRTEEVFQHCKRSSWTARSIPSTRCSSADLKEEFDQPQRRRLPGAGAGLQGHRASGTAYSKDDERDLILQGLRGLSRPAQGHRRRRPSPP